jgi:hypothetical protein
VGWGASFMPKPIAPPEAFTRAHAVDDEQPDLPETTYLDTPEYRAWLKSFNESNALEREDATMRALDDAGVPPLVAIGPGVQSGFPADRVRWLAARRTEED